MREPGPPFKFDFKEVFGKVRRKLDGQMGSVSINLPFFSFSLNPDDLEEQVARELLIRMSDRRVLNAGECCDNCIDEALTSLQEIRCVLVEKQVELSRVPDSPLYLLIELQADAIRQFLTFEQRLVRATPQVPAIVDANGMYRRPPDMREQYFAALEMLRGHLSRCLAQIAKIADTAIPKTATNMPYDEAWQLEAYEQPMLPNDTGA